MIRKIKQALGIEGVKIQIDVPVEQEEANGMINGHFVFETKSEQTVKSVNLRLVETYTRGRRKAKRIDEYVLGEITLDINLVVTADKAEQVSFELAFDLMPSRVEEFQSKNFLFKGVGGLAKFIKNAHSKYHLEAVANVKGTALSPLSRREIYLH